MPPAPSESRVAATAPTGCTGTWALSHPRQGRHAQASQARRSCSQAAVDANVSDGIERTCTNATKEHLGTAATPELFGIARAVDADRLCLPHPRGPWSGEEYTLCLSQTKIIFLK